MPTKGPFLEQIEGYLENDGGTDIDELAILTPVSRTEKMAMLIHYITLMVQQPAFSAGSWESVAGYILSSPYAGANEIPFELGNEHVIHMVKEWAQEGIIAGTWTRWREGEQTVYFNPPMLYAKPFIYLSSDVSLAQGAGKYVMCKIGYTLDKVSDADFISALVE